MDAEEVRKSLLGKFREVTADRLEKIGLGLVSLESQPGATGPYEDVARELHTLKGEARMLSLPAIAEVAHAAEDLLKASRDKRVKGNATDLLLRACDAIGELADDLKAAEGTHAPSAELVGKIREAVIPGPETPAAPPVEVHVAEPSSPGVEGAPEPAGRADGAAAPARADRSIRVSVDVLDSLGSISGDLIVEGARALLRVRELAGLVARFGKLSDRWSLAWEMIPAELRASVPASGELETEIHQIRSDAFRYVRKNADGVHALQGALARLGDAVTEARLVPLATVFSAFPRAVRDMAKGQGKEVELHLDNADVAVDPSVLGEIRDALVHLLRNAVDHGVEHPAVRLQRGKPRAGRIKVVARTDGDMLSVVVEDDGEGLDAEKLKAVAIERGMLNASQAAALTERSAWDLIFLPGLSTRREVSEISGRGVGMDVVKQKVETLGGSVSVYSREHAGLRVSLRLPQSVSLMKALLLRLAGKIYGLPAGDVEGVGRIGRGDRMDLGGGKAVRWRGRPVSLASLGSVLGVPGEAEAPEPLAVVVRHGEDRAAFLVEGFMGEREVAVKPCGGTFLKGARYVGGAAVLEDGQVAVLLQVPDLMSEVRKSATPAAAQRRALRILLVEDSPIARATEVALVRSLGHQVVEAVDGEDALSKLGGEAFDLIISDVQMPRMDGIALTRRVKSDAALGRLPIVILSSLASPEDKRRGLDAGADAYLIKGELNAESLAQTLSRLA